MTSMPYVMKGRRLHQFWLSLLTAYYRVKLETASGPDVYLKVEL